MEAEKGSVMNMEAEVIYIDEKEIDFNKYMDAPPEAEKVIPASQYQTQLIDAFHAGQVDPGCYLPWHKTHGQVKMRPGEFTLWPGINAHGKSMVINLIMLSIMAQSERVCIASFEMKPRRTMQRMVRQFSGVMVPTISEIKKFSNWLIDRLWIYDQLGSVKADRLLAVIRYCFAELDIHHFVIDSLMMCGIGTDDYNKQKWFAAELSGIARDYNKNIHLDCKFTF